MRQEISERRPRGVESMRRIKKMRKGEQKIMEGEGRDRRVCIQKWEQIERWEWTIGMERKRRTERGETIGLAGLNGSAGEMYV